jgi:lysophospholipase L1-like esterase
VYLVKAPEGFAGEWVFSGFDLPNNGQAVSWPEPDTRRILFIGDSITCGYGIEADGPETPLRNQDQNFCLTYAGLTARALKADYEVVARSGIGFYRNYNGPLEGSTDNMPALFDRVHFRHKNPVWNHEQFTPDLILINLGTNDFSTDGPDVELLVSSGVEFLNRLNSLYPDSRLLLLAGPLQKSNEYHSVLQSMLDQSVYNEAGALFVQSPQGSLGFGTHWHPSIRQARKNADELIVHLREWMGW